MHCRRNHRYATATFDWPRGGLRGPSFRPSAPLIKFRRNISLFILPLAWYCHNSLLPPSRSSSRNKNVSSARVLHLREEESRRPVKKGRFEAALSSTELVANSRFGAALSCTDLEEMQASTIPEGTSGCEGWAEGAFEAWKTERGITADIYGGSDMFRAKLLKQFFGEVCCLSS